MKSTKIALMLFALTILLLGCEKDEVRYSCDEQVHNWTSEHAKSLEDLNRAELATLPFNYQKAAFRSFSPEKQCEIWIEKIDLVLSQDWNNEELMMINEVKRHLTPNFFSPENVAYTLDITNEWINKAFEIGMDSVTIVVNFFHIATMDEIEQLVMHPEEFDYSWIEGGIELKQEPDPPPIYGVDCDCDWDTSCSLINMGFCELSTCDATTSGCGFLWLYKCEERCDGEDPNQ